MIGIGILAGFMSGLFGIGGGVIVTPLLIIAYPAVFKQTLSIALITGLSSAQGFFSSLISFLLHRKKHRPDWPLIQWFAAPMALANLLASLNAHRISENIVIFIFGALGLMSLLITIFNQSPWKFLAEKKFLYFPLTGMLLGILCGITGQGGGFIYLPVLISIFGLPIKQAISTSAATGIISASGAFFGRFNGDLDFLWPSIYLVGGIFIGSYFGVALSNKLSASSLKRALNLFILLCSTQLIFRALHR
ncbi:MAG: sulfite exporter TauE/SafE family protein [Comamonas sp.]